MCTGLMRDISPTIPYHLVTLTINPTYFGMLGCSDFGWCKLEPRLLIFPWYPYRSGWLFAAVYKELWTGEGRRWPAAEDHPSGAGGSGGIPHRTPGADPGSCGPSVRSGESLHTPLCAWSFICCSTVPYCTMLTKISRSLWEKQYHILKRLQLFEIENDSTYLITWTGLISHNIPGFLRQKRQKLQINNLKLTTIIISII